MSPWNEGRGARAWNWFIVHTYSGFEERVRQNLKPRGSDGDGGGVREIRIPTETLVEMKGASAARSSASSSRHIIIEMEMSDEAWHLVKNTPKVTGFVGSGKGAHAADGRGRADPPPRHLDEGEAQAQAHVREGRARPDHRRPFHEFHPASSRTSTLDRSTLKVMESRSSGVRRPWSSSSCRSRRSGEIWRKRSPGT